MRPCNSPWDGNCTLSSIQDGTVKGSTCISPRDAKSYCSVPCLSSDDCYGRSCTDGICEMIDIVTEDDLINVYFDACLEENIPLRAKYNMRLEDINIDAYPEHKNLNIFPYSVVLRNTGSILSETCTANYDDSSCESTCNIGDDSSCFGFGCGLCSNGTCANFNESLCIATDRKYCVSDLGAIDFKDAVGNGKCILMDVPDSFCGV